MIAFGFQIFLLLFFILLAVLIAAGWLHLHCALAWPSRLKSLRPARQENESAHARPVPHRKELLRVFLAALCFRLCMLILCLFLLCMQSRGEGILETVGLYFRKWDGAHYINLVELGYDGYVEDGAHLFLVFFPLYVWITRLFSFFTGSIIVAGLAVSYLSYAGGCCFLYALVAARYTKRTAQNSCIYLSVFPFAFFFGEVMTESLFFLTVAAALYFIYKHNWLAAGLFGFLSATTRMHGLLLIIPAAIELLSCMLQQIQSERDTEHALKKAASKLPFILLPILGSLCYLLLNYCVDGDPMAFLQHQEHWYQSAQPFTKTILDIIRYILKGNSSSGAIWIPELVLFCIFSLLLVIAVFCGRHKTALLVYSLVGLLLIYSMTWLLSAGRYLSCSVGFFIFAADYGERHPWFHRIWLGTSCVFLGVFFYGRVAGLQIM